MVEAHLVDKNSSFSAFSHIIDSRILRALADLEFARPTLVQAKAIPLALENRDILARARTGSGKTAAYCIPVAQKILSAKSNLDSGDVNYQTTRSLILVPTRELAEQVYSYLKKLSVYCDKDVLISNAASMATASLQRQFRTDRILLSDKPDIVISTPSKALALLQSKALSLASIETLVIDEADLILSYGHDEDVRQIFNGSYLPKVHQTFLMSATMTEDVEMLKGLTLRNPAILKLEDGEDEASNLSQYSVRCSEVDKFLFTYVILKLKLIRGKCIIFVNDVDRSYRVKLFLEQFSIKSCVLNSELPLNSRYHVVQEFNKGVYDYIIATDEGNAAEYDTDDEEEEEEECDFSHNIPVTSTQRETTPVEGAPAKIDGGKRKRNTSPASKSRKRNRKEGKGKDKEYGVTRGVDFVDVTCVLNFDLPTSSRSYTHRVGRTARAGRTGMSLSFVVPQDQWGKNKVVGCLPSAEYDEVVFSKIEKEQAARGSKIKDYKFDMKQVEGFRYRMEDALRSVTRSAIKEARIKELKAEILNSDKLKAHFEDNPLDLEFLRHDKPLHPTRVQSHMKHVPKYLLPRIAPVPGTETTDAETNSVKGFVPFKKDSARNRGRGRGRGGSNSGRGGRKKSDPLKKFGR
ncbi:P-loop containing nucleoside triphosphate hydrolase protein [Panaeolus papilionaceus]|nr:P-loop containing nucleoside triphosphate hydrolase protein [Panaeolus papilionaceus]